MSWKPSKFDDVNAYCEEFMQTAILGIRDGFLAGLLCKKAVAELQEEAKKRAEQHWTGRDLKWK